MGNSIEKLEKQAEIFVFTSFQGGSGKSSLTYHFSREYQKVSGKRGVVLEMNIFSPSTLVGTLALKDKLKSSFMDFFITNWQGLTTPEVVNFFTQIDGLFIVPFVGNRSAESLRPRFSFLEPEAIQPMNHFIDAFLKHQAFIAIDLPLSFSQLPEHILKRADVIFYVYSAEPFAIECANTFLKESEVYPEWKQKIWFIKNMVDPDLTEEETPLFEKEIFIPFGDLFVSGAECTENFLVAMRKLAEKALQMPAIRETTSIKNFSTEPPVDPLLNYKRTLRTEIVNALEKTYGISDQELRKKVEETIDYAFSKNPPPHVPGIDSRFEVKKYLMDEILGLGPLEELMRDPEVDEVMVNGPGKIFVERKGQLFLTGKTFNNADHVRAVIDRILMPTGRTVNERTPYVDARLPDGSRAHAIIPPLSLTGPMLTIRKFSRTPYTIEDLIYRFKTMTPEIGEFLKLCVKLKKNLVVSGGASSGKTTLLNVLSSFIGQSERVICIEDSSELKLSLENLGRLEARQQGTEAKNQVTIRDLVRNALRMRPDRIIVGECRAEEALDMLQAMNTGHDGSMTTLHANSPRDALARLETMVLMAGVDLPLRAIREQIASSVNIIIQTGRFSDGTRKIVEIAEICGIEDTVIHLQTIFKFQKKWITEEGQVFGEIVPTGIIPNFLKNVPGNLEETTRHLFEKHET